MTLTRAGGRRAAHAAVFAGALVARAVLTVLLTLLGWGVLPQLLGGVSTTVMTGSMAPRIAVGDVVVSLPIPDRQVHIGNVLLVDDPDHPGRLRLHRLRSIDDDGLLMLKGDANARPDSSPVPRTAVEGVALLRIPAVGLPVVWARTGRWVELATAGAGVLLLVALVRAEVLLEEPEMQRRPPRRRTIRKMIAVLAGGALSVAVAIAPGWGPRSWAAFSASTANPTSTINTICTPAFTPADGPDFSYTFNETGSSTTLPDASGNSRTGTLVGAGATRSVCASNNRFVNLDGSGAFVVRNTNPPSPASATVEFWFKTTTTGAILADFGDSTTGDSGSVNRSISLKSDGGLSITAATVYSPADAANKNLNNGAWHLVDMVFGPSPSRSGILYIDGVQMSSQSNVSPGAQTNQYWRFGGDSGAYLNGSMDNVAVYSKVLTGAQVSAHYATGR